MTVSILHGRSRRRLSLLVISAALLGCGADLLPGTDLEGVYQMQQMNGGPLPYDHEGLGCCTYLSGELVLERGSYAISLMARNRNTGLIFTAWEWGRYQQAVSSVTFAPDSFEVAPFLLGVGTLSGDAIQVALGGEGPGSPDQFQTLFVRIP